MRRLLGLLLLITSLLWQSAANAGALWLLEPVEDAEHVVLHWEQEAHHHHDDGTYHAEDSDDGMAHVQLDGALHGFALIGAVPILFGPAASVVPTASCCIVLPLPPPDGLRRPPRTFT